MNDGIYVGTKEESYWDNRFKITSNYRKVFCETLNDEKWLNYRESFLENKIYKNILYEILKTLPVIHYKDKKFIPFLSKKSCMEECGISFFFNPIMPLTKKNFF